MRSLLALLSISLTGACVPLPTGERSAAVQNSGTPSAALVHRIETVLAEDPCVGSLDRWARYYRWQQGRDGPNREVVDIDLRQAGIFGYRRGRYILSEPDPRLKPGEIIIEGDDRRYLVAFASYDVRLDQLTMESCGPNRRDREADRAAS